MTFKEAVVKFVSQLNAVPEDMIETLMGCDPGSWEEVTVFEDGEEPYDVLPMWGTMWSFEDWTDEYWADNEGGIEKMSKLGFRIYRHEEWGLFFGIDGAGYDFYEAHWEPLYKARGLQWHSQCQDGPKRPIDPIGPIGPKNPAELKYAYAIRDLLEVRKKIDRILR